MITRVVQLILFFYIIIARKSEASNDRENLSESSLKPNHEESSFSIASLSDDEHFGSFAQKTARSLVHNQSTKWVFWAGLCDICVWIVRYLSSLDSRWLCYTTTIPSLLPLYLSLSRIYNAHDDVIKWKLLPRYWPFVRGIHLLPVNSPHKGQWRGALMFLWSAPE